MSKSCNHQPAMLLLGFDAREQGVSIASELLENGYPVLAVCAPGSGAARAAREYGCEALEADADHALRAGLEYVRDNMPDITGVVTVNLWGGYPAQDILAAAEALSDNPDRVVLSSRANTPGLGVASRFGRWLLAVAFALVHGRAVKDPWSGLRAIPRRYLDGFLVLKGGGRKLAFNMLLNLHHMGIKTVNLPACAKYAASDCPGLFDWAASLFKVLLLPLKFVSASLVCTAVDYGLYVLFGYIVIPGQWQIAVTIGRFSGAATGYVLNRNVVFGRKGKFVWRKEIVTVLKFAVLAVVNYGLAIGIMTILIDHLGFYKILAKLATDALLFALSYLVQRDLVFRKTQSNGKK